MYEENLSKFNNAVIKYYIVDKYLKNNPLIMDKEHLRTLPHIHLNNIESNTFTLLPYKSS